MTLHKYVNTRNGLQFSIGSLVVKLARQEKQAYVKNLQASAKTLRNQEEIQELMEEVSEPRDPSREQPTEVSPPDCRGTEGLCDKGMADFCVIIMKFTHHSSLSLH